MYQIGWFSTGRDKAARDLLATVQSKIERGEIKAEITFVFSNREPGESKESDLFFKLVKSYEIPLVCFSSRKFRSQAVMPSCRLEYDREVMKRLKPFQTDLCVLAGYMLIVGEEMCQRYKMINLHPAAPGGPTGTWQEVIWKLIESRSDESGVMMHLVTPDLDKGPPLTYCTFPIKGKPFDRYWEELEKLKLEEVKTKEGENNLLFKLIRQQELEREFPLIIETLKEFSEGKIKIDQKKVLNARGEPIEPYDLTEEIKVNPTY